ncbi:MAG: ABC transporter ATP-binding protein [Candidatus Neomarinimicrobiota bacterium]
MIEIKALSKTYPRPKGPPVVAVDNLSLTIGSGLIYGFLGPNGAGKTTTIKMICSLVRPDRGTVRLDGRDVIRERGAAMTKIGVVLEGTRNVYWRLTAWENLMYFGRLKGRTAKQMRPLGERLLKDLDLWDRRYSPVRQFSRGMQQKVAIACALIADPPIILLDEPTLGLDVQSARTVRQWIRRLVSEEGKTVVLTTHQLRMAEELCERVAIIQQGRLIADEPVDKLLTLFTNDHFQVRVDSPLPDTLIEQYPQLKVNVENGVTELAGPLPDQDMLYQLLEDLRAAGAQLRSVRRVEPDLEEVFVRLLAGEGGDG